MDHQEVGVVLHGQFGGSAQDPLTHSDPETPAMTSARDAGSTSPRRATSSSPTVASLSAIQALASSLRASRLEVRK
jgi:hypothetical protein